MNWRICLLPIVSIVAAASLSCHGPETGASHPKIAVESDKSSRTQGPLDNSRSDRRRFQEELIPLAGLVDSFL